MSSASLQRSYDHGYQDPLTKADERDEHGCNLVVAGVLIFMLSNKPNWFTGLFDLMGSYLGSCHPRSCGVAMLVFDSRKNKYDPQA